MACRYLANDGKNNELTLAIKSLIINTNEYIKVSSFLMQDAQISDMLKELAMSGKAAVFLLSNKKDKESEEYVESMVIPSKDQPKNVGFDNHGKFLKDLFYSGIHVRLLDDLHAKFILSDGKRGLIMSANLAPNSLKRNIESGIEIEGEELKELEYVFDNMYKHADIVKFQGAYQKDITVKVDNKINPKSFIDFHSKIRLTVASKSNTNLSLCGISTIYDSILGIINNAKKYVVIVTWHFKSKDKTIYDFYNSVQAARKRGVKVILYSNTKTNTPSLKLSKIAIQMLTSMGCTSYGDDKNHSKCVLSESEGILFTANIDSENGMKYGFEVGCIMTPLQRKMAEQHINNILKRI